MVQVFGNSRNFLYKTSFLITVEKKHQLLLTKDYLLQRVFSLIITCEKFCFPQHISMSKLTLYIATIENLLHEAYHERRSVLGFHEVLKKTVSC